MRRGVTHDAPVAPARAGGLATARAGGLAAALLAFLAVLASGGVRADAQQPAAAANVPEQPASATGHAQGRPARGGARWFPDTTALAPLLADPRDTGLRGGFILADRPQIEPPRQSCRLGGCYQDFEGRNIEAEVALGLRLPVVLLREETRGGPSIAIEFETGVFTRFFMEESEKDLINADFRVGAPISFGYRGWEARIELQHISSHFGDDFVRRFEPPYVKLSQEGFEVLLARRFAAGARIYGGGEWNFGLSDPAVVERKLAHWGMEYDPGAIDGDRRIWPYAAADFRLTDLTDDVAVTGVAGAGFRVGTVGLRLEARGHVGPSPMGQLRRFDENFWGVGLRIEPLGAF